MSKSGSRRRRARASSRRVKTARSRHPRPRASGAAETGSGTAPPKSTSGFFTVHHPSDCPWMSRGTVTLGECAGRREDRRLLGDDLHNPVLAVTDLEDELANEGLVVVLAERLVSLR